MLIPFCYVTERLNKSHSNKSGSSSRLSENGGSVSGGGEDGSGGGTGNHQEADASANSFLKDLMITTILTAV